MSSVTAVEQCKQAYEKLFEGTFARTESQEQAAESCAHFYLDGKPVKKGYSHQVRTAAFLQCSFWHTVTDAGYSSDVISYALGRSLHYGHVDEKLFQNLLKRIPETLKRGIRYSQIFLQPDSPPWTAILSIVDSENLDFQQFIKICERLYEELQQHNNRIQNLQKQLNELTIFEYLLYGSLFTFQNLVPERSDLPKIDDGWAQLYQSIWDALSELLIWKVKADLKMISS